MSQLLELHCPLGTDQAVPIELRERVCLRECGTEEEEESCHSGLNILFDLKTVFKIDKNDVTPRLQCSQCILCELVDLG